MSYVEPAAPRRVLPIAIVAGGAAFLVVMLLLGEKGALAGGVVFLIAVAIALADSVKPVFTWPNTIGALVLLIWFVPIKVYALPIALPFKLEAYRLFLLAPRLRLGESSSSDAADGWTRPAERASSCC